MSFLRTFVSLVRPAALPTVWSNCLAGWWLGGGVKSSSLPFLFAGATLLYMGGAFLNDAFDAAYDRQHGRLRPIPSGAISAKTVQKFGWLWLILGLACLFCLSLAAAGFGLALVCSLLLFNSVHRLVTVSGVLLGICRFFLYVSSAATAADGITGWSLWCGLALAAYVIGFNYYAEMQENKTAASPWPALLLAVPILLALLMNVNSYRHSALLLAAVVGLWCLYCLRSVFWPLYGNDERAPSALLAGIVFVDWLAAADAPRRLSLAFIILFLATLSLQRLTPRRAANR